MSSSKTASDKKKTLQIAGKYERQGGCNINHNNTEEDIVLSYSCSDTDRLFDSAQRVTKWMVANQCHDRLDANKGRLINTYVSETGEFDLTCSWQTGGVCMGLLAMHKRTGEGIYLDRAELAGRYIMSLQVMDPREERYYGVIRECTPQSLELCPRDATTAAWSLVWLYEATQNYEYLDRAILFGNWLMRYGMYKGWPIWAVFMDGEFTDNYARGSFQSGTGLFFYDLFMATGDIRYIEEGMEPIAKRYRDSFFKEDGSIILRRDVFSEKIHVSSSKTVEYQIHKHNDDFGCSMLQAAANLFGDESYREIAKKYVDWLAEHQEPDGGFKSGGVEIHSAVPMAAMYFDELGGCYKDAKLIAARDKAIEKVLTMQFDGTGDPRQDGGFQGVLDSQPDQPCVHMRTSMYCLIALLKLENKIKNIWLGKNNCPFVDPLKKFDAVPYRFKW